MTKCGSDIKRLLEVYKIKQLQIGAVRTRISKFFSLHFEGNFG